MTWLCCFIQQDRPRASRYKEEGGGSLFAAAAAQLPESTKMQITSCRGDAAAGEREGEEEEGSSYPSHSDIASTSSDEQRLRSSKDTNTTMEKTSNNLVATVAGIMQLEDAGGAWASLSHAGAGGGEEREGNAGTQPRAPLQGSGEAHHELYPHRKVKGLISGFDAHHRPPGLGPLLLTSPLLFIPPLTTIPPHCTAGPIPGASRERALPGGKPGPCLAPWCPIIADLTSKPSPTSSGSALGDSLSPKRWLNNGGGVGRAGWARQAAPPPGA